MALTHQVRTTITDSTGVSQATVLTLTGDTELNMSIDLTTGETAVEKFCALPVDTMVLKSLYIKASCAVTALKFYSAAPAEVGSPGLVLSAGVPVVWNTGAGPCPIGVSADIVTLKHTNNTATSTLEIRALFGAI